MDVFDGVGELKGWQWLFIIEALPSLMLGVAALRVLTDKPEDAVWLSRDEQRALSATLEAERTEAERVRVYSLRDALTGGRVLALGIVFFGIAGGLYGLTFWLPQIVKAFGVSNTMAGAITAAPYIVSAVAMVVWGRHSDRRAERVWHIAAPCFLAGAALVLGTLAGDPALAFLALTIAAIGIFAALPTFWTLPTSLLTGAAAAGGIALINAIANIGGFVGPYSIGWIMELGYSAEIAVSSLAIPLFVSGLLVIRLGAASR